MTASVLQVPRADAAEGVGVVQEDALPSVGGVEEGQGSPPMADRWVSRCALTSSDINVLVRLQDLSVPWDVG